MNLRPLGYEPSELPSCSTPRRLCHVTHRRPTAANRLFPKRQEPGLAQPEGEALALGEGEVDADGDALLLLAAAASASTAAWIASDSRF